MPPNGQSLQISTLANLVHGATWRLELLHDLPFDLLIWVTRGQGRALLQGHRRGISTHNLLWIPAGTMFSLDLGKQSNVLALSLPIGNGLGFPPDHSLLRVRDVQAQSEVTGRLESMARELQLARPFAEEAARAHAALLSVWFRRHLLDAPSEPRPTAALRLVRAFCAQVSRNHGSGKSMAAYAQDLGVTPTHLSRVCKQVSDLTAADIITQRTLHAARDKVEASTLPFQVIAAELGFGSAAYFTRFVQNHTGQSPTALRRAHAA